jgi:hypothetical protein
MAGNLSQDAAGHSCRGARLAVHAGPSLTLLAYLCSSGHDPTVFATSPSLPTENSGKGAAFVLCLPKRNLIIIAPCGV